jgi:hypothetical protein
MAKTTLGRSSRLKRIGEFAFLESPLTQIIIRASTEQVEGSSFVGFPLERIELARGNRNFRIEGKVIAVSGGTKFVSYFSGCHFGE